MNSTHKAKTDCPVVGCKVIQKRMDHLKKHYVSMVVWEGDNPVSSGSAEYKRARHRSKRAVKSSLFCQTLKLIEDGEVVLVVFRPAHYTNCSSIVLIIMCSAVISF